MILSTPRRLFAHNVTCLVLITLCVAPICLAEDTAAPPFPGAKSDFHGYDCYTFRHNGQQSIVVTPHECADGKPWIWRARFWGHEPQVDTGLLEKGFHVAYTDVGGLFGNPKAVERWNAFYTYLTEEQGFSKTPALEGMSRGGLIIYNWAAANPDSVSCIYADAPVVDFKSWPGGKGVGKGSPAEWKKCQKVYGLTEAEALAYTKNPIDQLAPLAKTGIPLLHVCGGTDKVVPVSENTAIIEKRYRALGGDITVIIKKLTGHHPHCLKDPAPIIDFVLKHTKKDSQS